MARARGSSPNTQLLIAYEASYGSDPGGNYQKVPFISLDLGGSQDLIADEILGSGRDPKDAAVDLLTVGGQIVVPLDLRNIGYWLKGLLGAPDSAGSSAPYTHRFVSGKTTLPSMAIEVGLGDVPAYFLNLGCKINSFQVGLSRRGRAQATLQIAGQSEAKNTTTQGGTAVSELTVRQLLQREGNIQRNGSDLSSILTSNLTYVNNLEAVETIRSDALVEGQDEGVAALTGDVTSRFADTTLLDDAIAGTFVALSMPYTIDSDNKITLKALRALLQRAGRSIGGPGGVDAPFSWQASEHVLTAPTTPAAAKADGGSLADDEYFYVITALDSQGRETAQSTEVSDTTETTNNTVDLSWDAEEGAASYKIYRSTTTATYGASSFLAEVQVPSYSDDGGTALSSGSPPSATESPATMFEIVLINDVANYDDPNGN